MEEEWRLVYPWPAREDYPSRCQVSSLGRVRYINDRAVFDLMRSKVGALTVSICYTMKPPPNVPIETVSYAYYYITRQVANIVAQAFLAPPGFKVMRIQHIDGNKENCRLDNIAMHSLRRFNEKDMIVPWES